MQASWRMVRLIVLCAILSGVSLAAPTVTNISPQSGIVGAYITISGSGFGTTQDVSTVTLNSINVGIASWSDTSIVAIVPAGATSGPFAVTVGGQTGDSPTFTVTLLPSAWADADIGTVGLAGSATYTGGAFTVKGAGTGMSGTADSMHFAYQSLSGDGSIVARVNSLQGVSYPYAGVMIRETLSPGATDAFVYFTPYASFYDRATTGGSSAIQTLYIVPTPPYWVKLTRAGNSFTGYVSPDGQNWTQVGNSTTVAMA
jgi:hypothetical protein